jgi:glycosyltransferase involved in cell wall biosynthesis
MTRVLCVMEQHLGHRTYYENLRRFVAAEAAIEVQWAAVTYQTPAGWSERVPYLPAHVRGTLRGRAEVRRALRTIAHEVVFFNTQVPGAIGSGWFWRRPYVVATDITPRQYDQLGQCYQHQPDRFGPVALFKHLVNTRLLRQAACVLPWSSWARESLIRDYGVAPDRIEVIPPGVDLQYWRPGEGRASDPVRILFVGGDLYRKGGATLLQAFRSLPQGTCELHLVTRTQVAPEAGVIPYYDLNPNAPGLMQLYQQADLFVLPTEAEAFGIAAVEACASGLATISTASGGLTDVVVDGENGFLVAPGDSRELAARMRRLIEDTDLRLAMGRAGRVRAERYFDARRNAARIATVLQQVAQQQALQPAPAD